MSNEFTNENDIKKAVDELLVQYGKHYKSEYSIRDSLKKKYSDKQIDEIIKKRREELSGARKLAEKIKQRLLSKYPGLPKEQYIRKISEYKNKYKFSDAVMSAVLYMIFNVDKGNEQDSEFENPYTNMSKALGFVPQIYQNTGDLNFKGEEDRVKEIVKLNDATKSIHDQVELQSFVYQDCSVSAINNNLFRNVTNIYQHIHPVLFALFCPKIDVFERQMLLASISNIVATKYKGENLQTQPDMELYNNICTDPVETTCTSDSNKPFTDLASRAVVQANVWENVLQLRQGKYYSANLSAFVKSIDECKSNIFDMANYAYVKDEATILRKLLAVFSIRPTYISTTPFSNMMSMQSSNMAQIQTTHVTTVPMIPLNMTRTDPNTGMVDDETPINLRDALNERQVMFHNKQLVVKEQQIIHSKEIIIIYVNRRYQANSFTRIIRPGTVPTLPITLNTYERLNSKQVNFSFDLQIPDSGQNFELKSAIAVETARVQTKSVIRTTDEGAVKNQIIVGCSAIVIPDNNDENYAFKYSPIDYQISPANRLTPEYKPVPEASKTPPDRELANVVNLPGGIFVNPISIVPLSTVEDGTVDLVKILQSRGTIFIYKCTSGHSRSNPFEFDDTDPFGLK